MCSSLDLEINKKKPKFVLTATSYDMLGFINIAAETVFLTLVTEDASPALLADAVPRFITGTMFTRWMEFTHITKETLPAFSASVHTKW